MLHQYPTADHAKVMDFIASFKSIGSGGSGGGISFVDEAIGSHSLTSAFGQEGASESKNKMRFLRQAMYIK